MGSTVVLELTAEADILENLPLELSKAFPDSFLGAAESLPLESKLELHEGVPEWIEPKSAGTLACYFSKLEVTQEVQAWIEARFPRAKHRIYHQPNQDWNALWRSHFKGGLIEPCWKIVPVWVESEASGAGSEIVIRMNPSLGFGTGEHPTTRLCLKRMGEWPDLRGKNVLDFGSGSGVLSVAAALRGARSLGVEIDEMALESSRELADLNQVSAHCQFQRQLLDPSQQNFDLIVANILRATLLEFSQQLVVRLKSSGRLLISGLLEEHVEEVRGVFEECWIRRFGLRPQSEIRAWDQWRSIEFW